MSIGALKEGIINATELEGVFGQNVHESKDVVLRIDGKYYPLSQVSIGFLSHTGQFAMFLDGGDPL